MEYVTLNNGVKMPKLGYGVFQVSNEECERCVLDALSVGYRSIDTAQSYGNEEAVGSAVQKSGVPRGELFLTSKIWMSNASYEKAKASIDKSLQKMKTDYLDLMLIHQPFGDYYGAYRAMEEAYKAGTLRAIGVCNMYPARLADFCETVEVIPAVNQVELHPFFQQENALALGEEIDVLSDDLADVESVVFDEDEDDEDYFEVECPNCEEPIIIDDEALAAGEVQCPNCETRFALDLSDDGDEEETDED